MEKLSIHESELHGKWMFNNGNIVEDETAKRINYLKSNYLIKLAESSSGWKTLYQDPNDKRYWELNYLNSDWQGGGPPSLFCIDESEALKKYIF